MTKKLRLHRETLRKLDALTLGGVAGATLAATVPCVGETLLTTLTNNFRPSVVSGCQSNIPCGTTSAIGC